MKKVAVSLLAIMAIIMCLSICTYADTGAKTTSRVQAKSPELEDIYEVGTEGDGELYIVLNLNANQTDEEEDPETKEQKEKLLKAFRTELALLRENSADPDSYFINLQNQDREYSTMSEAAKSIGIENPIVDEFFAVTASGFDEGTSEDKVKAQFRLPTAYEENENVLFLVGIITQKEDGKIAEDGTPNVTQTVEWFAFDAVGLAAITPEEEGRFSVEIDLDIVIRMQNEMAVVAIVSEEAEEILD